MMIMIHVISLSLFYCFGLIYGGLKVGINVLDIRQESSGTWIKNYGDKLNQNKMKYAKKYSYDISFGRQNLFPFTIPNWSKYIYNLEMLDNKTDLVLYMDSDTKIMNFSIRIEDIDKFIQRQCGNYSVAMAKDKNGFNNGVYLLRNTPETYKILQESMKLINDTRVHSMGLFEQSAFGLVIENHPDLAGKVCVVSQSLFNSYPEVESYAGTQYKDGDFILHFVNTGKRVIGQYL